MSPTEYSIPFLLSEGGNLSHETTLNLNVIMYKSKSWSPPEASGDEADLGPDEDVNDRPMGRKNMPRCDRGLECRRRHYSALLWSEPAW